MKNILIYLILILIGLNACKKDCLHNAMPAESCDTSALVIIDSTSPSLRKYVIRNDTSALYGHATAIKSVSGKGEIAWIGNNGIGKVNDDYYLGMGNYGDTLWRNLEYWAYLREVISIKFAPFTLGRQKILNEQAYLADSTVSYSFYNKEHDDFTEATWKINTNEENYIIVNKIDQDNKIIEGEFDLHYTIVSQNPISGAYADEIRFRCGKFKSKIFE